MNIHAVSTSIRMTSGLHCCSIQTPYFANLRDPTVPLRPKTRTKAKDLYGLQASPQAFCPKEEENQQKE